MSAARILFFCELAFLAGIAVAAALPVAAWSAVIVCAGIVLCAWRLPARLRLLALLPLAWWLGVLRYGGITKEALRDPLALRAGSSVTLQAVIVQEVDARIDGQRLVVRAERIKEGDAWTAIQSVVFAPAGLYPVFFYGDRIHVHCQLVRPEHKQDFAYDEYLSLTHIFVLCRQAHITVVARGQGNPILQQLYAAKRWMTERIAYALPEPHASLAAAILLGSRQGLPADVQQAFRRTGLTHIVALSGYNISILIAALLGVALQSGMHRRRAVWIVCASIIAFVVMAGASASVVRAGMMGILFILARQAGSRTNVQYALVSAATAMVAANPRVLLFDVGFHLSFLSTVGLLVWATPIAERLRWVPTRFGIREAGAATLAATAMTLPYLLFRFGQLSLVSLFANLLVLPFMPLTMLASFAALLVPFMSVAAWLLLSWTLGISEVFGRIPFASIAMPRFPLWIVLLWYAGLVVVLLRRQPRTQ